MNEIEYLKDLEKRWRSGWILSYDYIKKEATKEKNYGKDGIEWPDDCILWKKARTSKGYGKMHDCYHKDLRAHRVSVMIREGRILNKDEHILHSCDNTRCINPLHLKIGTNTENVIDRFGPPIIKSPSLPLLNAEQVKEIKELLKENKLMQTTIAKKFGVSDSLISFIKQGKAYKDI